MYSRTYLRLAIGIAALLLPVQLLAQEKPVARLASPDPIPAETHIFYFEPTPGETRVPARPTPRTRGAATINVTYNGFDATAMTAFQAAVDLIEPLIESPVTIRVDATWANLQTCSPGDPCILGGARANSLWLLSFGPNTFIVGDALTDALLGSDQGGGAADIIATFNTGFSDWYLGTDGNPASDEVDFMSVVLHEVFHGLGFFGGARIDDGIDNGSNNFTECTNVAGTGCWGYGTANPVIYDVWVDSPIGMPLTDYTNNTAAVATALQNEQVHWQGENAKNVVGGAIKMFSPNPFQVGSSFSHFDEGTFGPGNPNSLMTPSIGDGEVIHDPGAALCLFKDLQWTVTRPCDSIFHDGWDSGDLSEWSTVVPPP